MAASCNRKVVTTAVAASVAAAAKAATDASKALIVPESLFLKKDMKEADCGVFPLTPLQINVDKTEITELTGKLSGDVLKEHMGTLGSICYVVRRPGGLILKELAANEHKPLEGFDLWGVIKETGVDDQGLCDFTSFYPYPLYKDDQLSFYKALGNRKLSLNPFSLFGTVKSMFSGNSRTKERNIEGNLVGEGLVKGGVIIFSKDGTPKYAYREVVGQELPVETILAAVHAVKKDQTA